MRQVAVIVITTTLLASSAGAQTQPCTSVTGRTVTVSGAATLRLKPDRASFSAGVETGAQSVSEAFKRNTAKLNAVVAALKKRGVASQEIQTSNFSIASRVEKGKKASGFRVSNLVTVTREDPASISELLQAAVAAGANQVEGLRFFVGDPGKSQPRGLEMAFQNARAKAEKLASLSGKSLGEVVCVADQSPSVLSSGFLARNYDAEAPNIEVGTEALNFNVSVVFELK